MNTQEEDISTIIIDLLKKIYLYLAKWYKTILIFLVLGILADFSFYYIKHEVYISKMIARSSTGDHAEIKELMVSLENTVSDPEKLSEIFGIHIKDAGRILEITTDTLTNKLIQIQVIYKEKLDFEMIEKKLVAYVTNNVYISQQIKLALNKHNKIKKELESEIKQLNNLQTILLSNLKDSKITSKQITLSSTELSFYQDDILARKKELIVAERELTRVKGLEIIKSFSPVNLKYYNLLQILKETVFLFLILGIVFTSILNIREYIKKK